MSTVTGVAVLKRARSPLWLLLALALAGCNDESQQALGTLEWDRIALPAPAAQKNVRFGVREGQGVAAVRPTGPRRR